MVSATDRTPTPGGTRIAVVDDDDCFVRWEARQVIHERKLWHRTVHVMVIDRLGRLIIQRRHRNKETYAGCWDISCSGHVEEGDYDGDPDHDLERVYEQTARREVHEELGISVAVRPLARFAPAEGLHYEWLRLFRASSNGPFTPQATEVEELRRVTEDELESMIAAGEPITPTLEFFSRLARARMWW